MPAEGLGTGDWRLETNFSQEFEDLVSEHYVMVDRTAYGVTGRVEDAEDVVQTIFLRLLKRGGPIDLGDNPKGYLYRAAVNQALSVVVARQRRERTQVGEEFALAVPARASSHAEDLHRKLYEAIAQLKPKAAQIVILKYLHNYSDGEIGRMLGTSRGVIAVTLFRLRARLKKLLGEES